MLESVNWGNVLVVTVIGFGLVFCLLVLLVGILHIFGKVMAMSSRKATSAVCPVATAVAADVKVAQGLTEAEQAAIAMALQLKFGVQHDYESYKLTMDDHYSQWNAKIFEINNVK